MIQSERRMVYGLDNQMECDFLQVQQISLLSTPTSLASGAQKVSFPVAA